MTEKKITLPKTQNKGEISVEAAIANRRSRRKFSANPLSIETASQILWSAGGQTGKKAVYRSAPSAGACHPLTILALTGNDTVEGISAGLYKYIAGPHELELLQEGDIRTQLAEACLGQKFVASVPLVIVMYAEYEKASARYGERGIRYSHIDTGHAGQNIYLQAEALGLGTVAVGAFDDEKVASVLQLSESQSPLYVMPVGYPA